MKKLIFCLCALTLSSTASAQCNRFVNGFVGNNPEIQYLSRQHFLVGPAFENVLSEYFYALKNFVDDPGRFTFEDALPTLGSLVGFLVVCEANGGVNNPNGHCGQYMSKIDRKMPSIISSFVLGASYAGC